MNFSDYEQEVINLKAINECIDSMINLEVFELLGSDPESQILFPTSTHQKYFNIILVDFLSNIDKDLAGESQSCLDILKKISHSPRLGDGNSVKQLRISVDILDKWLHREIREKVWLPSIDKQIILKILRIEFLMICGNISKHHFARLTKKTSRDLIAIFRRSGLEITKEESLILYDDFFEWFHINIFNYHSSAIAEMVNNIRWGIQKYLLPEFNNSINYSLKDPLKYEYQVPKEVFTDFGKSCYWELMNEVRSKPNVRKFEVTKTLKLRY